MKIIVVEDEERTRKGIIKLIQKCGEAYQVMGESDNGVEGAALIEDLKPDLVITDIRMPGMDGIAMLELLKQRGLRFKSIILSGYSEFDFARRALQTGVVSEYLLKPITADDLIRVLKSVENELLIDLMNGKEAHMPAMGPEELLRRYLENGDVNKELFDLHIHEFLSFHPDQDIQVSNLYLGEMYQEVIGKVKEEIRYFLKNDAHVEQSYLVELPDSQELVVLMQSEAIEKTSGTLADLWNRLNKKFLIPIVISWTSLPTLRHVKQETDQLRELHKWSILHVERPILFAEDLQKQSPPRHIQYPADIELKMKEALSSRDKEKVYACGEAMIAACTKQASHPEEVIEACLRFASGMLHLGEAINGDAMMTSQRNEIFHRITSAKTRLELGQALLMSADYVCQYKGKEAKVYSLVISKAIKIIQERYHTGLSLEEIANGCHVTPEYLSSLFQKELGVSFTAYIRDVRITKAKELLLNSSLKSFEIGERVGYPDAKYFSKVFKEMTG
ncbi:response regulator transcription factor [Paenibacillus hexagrammi]|uniref:Response regulator n=1 Tax=Paenibacillus hexagrammi TaxID=2908839 RepID=A0ABY3SF96_9BACL|nr:response regulator [Paenibacillus sp. YPD9-1]UJF32130.1 response regulator [Paenibacillus sp. YPD9-1]